MRKLPESVDARRERQFLREIEDAMNVERPAIVLDCSATLTMNRSAVHLILCCLEQAMKRNGDVRLAAVPPEAMESLQRSGVDRLFRIFSSNEEAARSFVRRSANEYFAPSHANVGSHQAA